MARTRRNERYLPKVRSPRGEGERGLPGERRSLSRRDPGRRLRDLVKNKPSPLVWLCKGFEQGTGSLAAPDRRAGDSPCGALSGPSFADEVARGLPCALTLASRDAAFAREAAAIVHGGRLRVYYSTDLVGVEIGGAVKNVMAIAAGICDGLGLGLQRARGADHPRPRRDRAPRRGDGRLDRDHLRADRRGRS
jgi:glycerol-3-phosphate dehydrogenase (NAD(P)+)